MGFLHSFFQNDNYVVLNFYIIITFLFFRRVLVGKANAWLAANADVFVINCETVETRSDDEDAAVDTSVSNSYDDGEQPMYYHRSLRYLFVCLFVCLFVYLFGYLFIYVVRGKAMLSQASVILFWGRGWVHEPPDTLLHSPSSSSSLS